MTLNRNSVLTQPLSRRLALAGAAGLAAFGLGGRAAYARVTGDRVRGPDAANLEVVEYASYTCPHCARFHADTLPTLIKDWVDTGKARFIYRDFVLNQIDLYAATMVRAAPPERQFAFIDTLYKTQAQWARSSDPQAALIRTGKLGGLSEDAIRAAWADRELQDVVLRERQDGQTRFNVESTPTIVVNGKPHAGALTVDEVAKLLAAAS